MLLLCAFDVKYQGKRFNLGICMLCSYEDMELHTLWWITEIDTINLDLLDTFNMELFKCKLPVMIKYLI